MIKNLIKLEHKIGDRVFHMYCDPDSPLGEVHDALSAMKAYIVARIKDAHELESKEKKDDCDSCSQEG